MSHLLRANDYSDMVHRGASCGVGPCRVKAVTREGEKVFRMTGPSGTHEMSVRSTDLDRLNAHWEGYLMNNGVITNPNPKPATTE